MFSVNAGAARALLSVLVLGLVVTEAGCPDPGPDVDTRAGPNRSATDLDGDGVANVEDTDLDGDGIDNGADHDMDGDRIPNEIDDDIDGDGTINVDDDTPLGSSAPGDTGPWTDIDGDNLPNIFDTDDDNDGIPDGVSGPGSCDGGATVVNDENADCDGYCIDLEAGLVACDDGGVPGSGFPDADGDGTPDTIDPDDDNDGIPDGGDTNPRGNDPCVGLEGPPPAECNDDPPGGEGEGEGEPQPTCNTQTFDPADPIPPRILLVVDRSGSMNEDADGFTGSKWDAAKAALVGTGADTGVVGQLEQAVEFGLYMYPAGSGTDQQCLPGSINDSISLSNHTDIRSQMSSTGPGGGTPTAPALVTARIELNRLGATGGQRAVILVTDGGPNCNDSLNGSTCRCVADPSQCQSFSANCLDDANTIAAANQLNQAGFPVFVLGIDGALAFGDVLTRTAQAGGTGNFFGIGSQSALAQTIEDIALRVGSCRFELSGAPLANQLTVAVDGAAVSQDTGRQNGWDLVGVNTVELFGAACDAAQRATQNVSVQTCF
jgi:hypothetical protein